MEEEITPEMLRAIELHAKRTWDRCMTSAETAGHEDRIMAEKVLTLVRARRAEGSAREALADIHETIAPCLPVCEFVPEIMTVLQRLERAGFPIPRPA